MNKYYVWRYRTFDVLKKKMRLGQFKNVLDLGADSDYFKTLLNPNRYVSVDSVKILKHFGINSFEPDVDMDLDTIKKYPFKDKEFDLIIASQVLEHLHNIDHAISEIKRISSRFLLIGLPNDMRIDTRLRCLFGINPINISKFAHCRLFDAYNSDSFISENFKEFKIVCKVLIYTGTGESHIPNKIRLMLPKISKNLFAGEIYYLLEKHSERNG